MKKVEKGLKKMADEEVTVTFKKSELFQLHLCIVARSAAATIKWANATSADEQNVLQGTIQYLTNLTEKINEALKNGEK